MLTRVDRVQVVVADSRTAAAAFERLLGAAVVREDTVHCVAARRTVLRLGSSEVELLQPNGTGIAADFLSRTKGGLFAAGFATPDLPRLRAHLEAHSVPLVAEGSQLFLTPEASGVPGLRVVVSTEDEPSPAGLVRYLYEATLLVQDFAGVVAQAAATFGLDRSHFVPIRSDEYGYEGTLTLFHPDRLHRMEIITPRDPAKTMGRFFARRGPSLYMCYVEADDLAPVRERLLEHAPNDWTGARDTAALDNLFIHPAALGGLMMGISRATFAWTWSGHPERVVPSV